MLDIQEFIGYGITAVNTLWQGLKDLWEWITSHTFTITYNWGDVPSYYIPDSPTPFEMGLRGIDQAAKDLSGTLRRLMPESVAQPANVSQVIRQSSYNYSSVGPTFHYAPVYQGSPPSPSQDFAVMQVWSR